MQYPQDSTPVEPEPTFDALMAAPDPRTTIVVNIKHEAYDVYIGRPTRQHPDAQWGNPFRMHGEDNREKVIRRYEDWLRSDQPGFLADLSDLAGKRLGCYCKPLPCHGDVLRRLLIEHLGAPGEPS